MLINNKIYNSRKNFDKLGIAYEKAENVIIKREVIEDINCYWFNKNESVNSKLIIYLHGGCFVFGSIQSHQSLVSHISKHLALPVLFIEYSLAPEKPFPFSLDDIQKVYENIIFQYPENDIIFMGDSAGAGLAVSVLSRLNKKGNKIPSCLVLLSPWIDLSCSNTSLLINAYFDPILTKKGLEYYASLYVKEHNLSEVNPIENISGPFPPTLILVGSREILLDDSKSIYYKLLGFQNKVKLSIYDNQNHVWMLENIHTEESKKTLKEIKWFIAD